MKELPILILAGLTLTIMTACGNYALYNAIFFSEQNNRTSITNKVWFRALLVPFIYFPALNVIGLLILLYLRAMKTLDIN